MSQIRFEDVEVGQTFIYDGQKYTKQDEFHFLWVICNTKDSKGSWCLFPMNAIVEVNEVVNKEK